jgi:hypothetical protein
MHNDRMRPGHMQPCPKAGVFFCRRRAAARQRALIALSLHGSMIALGTGEAGRGRASAALGFFVGGALVRIG